MRRIDPQGIEHIMDSSYCFPVGTNEIVLRLRTAADDFQKVWVIYESKYAIAEKQLKAPMEKKLTGRLYDYYSVKLKLEDTRLGYVFYLYDGKNYMYFSEDGLTKTYDFTKGYYNFFQYPYINEADILPRIDWCSHAVFYQIFVDRFCIGDPERDKSYVNCAWGDIPTPKSFAGGDLAGIRSRLDHIRGIGANCVYLTPIFQSVSNHKYDISDYYTVDRHFGTNEDLRKLVEEIHEKGMKIMLDAVFNHCSKEMEQFQDVLAKGRASEYYDWFVIDGDRPDPKQGNYEMFASCSYMPKLNTSNPQVQDYLIDVGTYYIREYDIDGWRLDVSDEVSHTFWRRFRAAVKALKKDCILIGENWHDASNYLRGDQFDSIMNYAVTKACLDYFKTGDLDARQMAGRLNDILARNTDTVNAMMLNLLDSHDTHRFFSEVGEDREKFEAALHLMYMFPGMPCIFYGTEIRMPGGFDPDCRRCMDWKAVDEGRCEESMEVLRKLGALRAKYDLSAADYRIRAVKDVLVIERYADDDVLTLYINVTDRDVRVGDERIKAHSHLLTIGQGGTR